MSFATAIADLARAHMARLKKAYDNRIVVAEERARRRMQVARTKTDREKIKQQLEQERLTARRELYEAQIATKKAKIATNKAKEALDRARKEAGDLTVGERAQRMGSEVGRGTAAFYKALTGTSKRRSTRRKTKRRA